MKTTAKRIAGWEKAKLEKRLVWDALNQKRHVFLSQCKATRLINNPNVMRIDIGDPK